MRQLMRSLSEAMAPIANDVEDIHDMAWRPMSVGRPQDGPRAPQSAGGSPRGDREAQAAYERLERLSTIASVRLAHVLAMHGMPAPPMAVGERPEAVAKRCEAIASQLSVLADHEALRSDKAMTEQFDGAHSQATITQAVDAMASAHRSIFPAYVQPESEQPCSICAERPVMNGRKRCNRCHSYFARHGRERPSDGNTAPIAAKAPIVG